MERLVTATRKDAQGVIQGLCGPFGFVSRPQAVTQINARTHRYYVLSPFGQRVYVHVYSNYFLRTNPDQAGSNNLDNLPNC